MRQSGFTLVELIVVMMIIGILAVAALPRFFDKATFESRGFHDETLSALRYAQKAAIAQRRNVCVTFNVAGTTVTLTAAATAGSAVACTLPLTGPTGASPFQVPPVGRSSSATFNLAPTLPVTAPVNFQFNALGKPSVGQTIQVIGATQNITVEQETGYVHPS